MVCVRDRKSARAYVVKPEIREWRLTAPAYGAYDAAQIELPYSQDNGSPALIPLSFDGSPPDLANKLEAATSLALDEVLNILRMETQPDDRSFQAILRAKSGIINTVISNQVRVDEAKLKNSQHNEMFCVGIGPWASARRAYQSGARDRALQGALSGAVSD